jgi:hypothetical protein
VIPHLRRPAVLGLLLTVVAFLALVVVAIAGSADPVVVEDSSAHPSPALRGPFEVDGPGAGDVAILQEPVGAHLSPSPPDARPGSQSALPLSLAGQGIDQPVPAHLVSRSLGEEITVAEVGNDACVGVDSLATCGSPQAIAEGHVVAVELCSPDLAAGSYRVLGMAPDGVETVRVETRGQSSATAAVRENTYEVIAPDVPDLIVWQMVGGDGWSVPAPVPPGYDAGSCQG